MIDIIAEVGSTWFRPSPQDAKEAAIESIKQAALAGATIVKFQVGLDRLYSPDRAPVQFDAVQRYALLTPWLAELRETADLAGVQLQASIFDPEFLGRPEARKLLGIKLASGELTPNSEALIRAAALYCTNYLRPLALSTGTHTDSNIRYALDLLRGYSWIDKIIYLCVSKYPAPPKDYKLESLLKYRQKYTIGLSDHTLGIELVDRAVELGYTAFEKHFRLGDCPEDNPDYPHSLSPKEFTAYVQAVRMSEAFWLGEPKTVHPDEAGEVLWMQRGSDGRRPRDEVKGKIERN